jgi:hypothetical protein
MYEAAFRSPLFALPGNPVSVLSVLHERLAPKWNVSLSELSVESARTLGDVKARINLFSGNGTLEITPETFTAKFINPSAPGDAEIIKDCVRLALDGLATISDGKNSFREETITLRGFIELTSPEIDGLSFLRTMHGGSELYSPVDAPYKADVIPGFRVEFLQTDEKWAYSFELTRAHRSTKELFLLSTCRFYDGNAIDTIDQKAEHAGNLLRKGLERIGLRRQDGK